MCSHRRSLEMSGGGQLRGQALECGVWEDSTENSAMLVFCVWGCVCVCFGNGFVFFGFVFWPFLLGWAKLVHWIGKYSTVFTQQSVLAQMGCKFRLLLVVA